ncbi:MAG: carB [Candidatus Eremiobacteraeota bacterium]|nr:carB [Candidatus Eremiobacteraeota bacterium]
MAIIKVFVRQPLTQTGEREARVIQAALDGIGGLVGDQRYALDFLTGTKAHDNGSFRDAFASEAGAAFAPRRFRDTRLALLARADVMLVVRTGLSESGAFEIAYNIFGGRRIPIMFAVWDEAEIKTTLLRDLDDLAKVRYVRFSDPATVAEEFARFVDEVVVPDMTIRGRDVASGNEPRAATTFREARRAARELGFPVTVRPWSAMPSQGIVVSDLGMLAQHVERNHIAITREMPLLVERVTTLPVRVKRPRVETGTYEPAARDVVAAAEARSA